MKPPFLLPLFLAFLTAIAPLFAQTDEAPAAESRSLFDFFYEQADSMPALRLDTNWRQLSRGKFAEKYQSGTLGFLQEDGVRAELNLKLRARGNARKSICLNPPVKFKFTKKELAALGFNDMNEIKIVLPCRTSPADEEYLLREALIYQLYELVHPVHVRAKIVRMEVWDGKAKRMDSYALLVEHNEEFEGRLNGKLIDRGVLTSGGLDRDAYLKMVFFQYMIANTDWAIPNRHNLHTISLPGYSKVVATPYDFDYSGFVDTRYSVPADVLPIKSVTERYFQGVSVTEEEALETARFFLSRKEALMDVCVNFPGLGKQGRKYTTEMLLEFFKVMENEKRVSRDFVTAKN
jgi:hypothetical protein